MFKEIEGFAEKVAEKVKAAEQEVKTWFDGKKAVAIRDFKLDITNFEKYLEESGIKLDDEFAADLAKIKDKLEAAEAILNPEAKS